MDDRAEDIEDLIGAAFRAAPVPVPQDAGLALVARECGFGHRYRLWRGRSGRRYLVTVMPISEAMRVEDAIVLLVATDPAGKRRILWAGESSEPLPGLRLSHGVGLEAHVHLLAASPACRRAALTDLVDGAQDYSSVLTVSAAASSESAASGTPRRRSSSAVFST